MIWQYEIPFAWKCSWRDCPRPQLYRLYYSWQEAFLLRYAENAKSTDTLYIRLCHNVTMLHHRVRRDDRDLSIFVNFIHGCPESLRTAKGQRKRLWARLAVSTVAKANDWSTRTTPGQGIIALRSVRYATVCKSVWSGGVRQKRARKNAGTLPLALSMVRRKGWQPTSVHIIEEFKFLREVNGETQTAQLHSVVYWKGDVVALKHGCK